VHMDPDDMHCDGLSAFQSPKSQMFLSSGLIQNQLIAQI
jgi:hypothetical protein